MNQDKDFLRNVSERKHLFDCLDYVRQRWLSLPRIVVFLDFDGTLAPIAPTPSLARCLPEITSILRALATDRQVSLVLISGRPLCELKQLLKLEGLIYAGNHGLEISGPALEFVHSGAAATLPALSSLCWQITEQLVSFEGVHVEDKHLTVSVHYRLAAAADSAGVRSIIEKAIETAGHSMRITEGKCAIELRPDVEWNKGTAARFILKQLRQKSTAAIYVGDDRTDEDAFLALRSSLTVHVGLDPAGTAARYFVKSPEGVYGFLEYLRTIRELRTRRSMKITSNS
jgi:trehalose-phosphatase